MGVSRVKDPDAKKSKEEKKKRGKEKIIIKKKKVVPEGIRGIIRIAETDVDGTKKLNSALQKIKGVGPTLAYAIPRALGIDPHMLAGALTDEQAEKIEQAVKEPGKFGVPSFLLNRRADPEEGISRHIVASALTIRRKFDIDRMKKIHCYKGLRHELGLPVRGQRTRGSFRTGMRVGVTRAKAKGKAPKGAPASAPKEAKAAATTPAAPAGTSKEKG